MSKRNAARDEGGESSALRSADPVRNFSLGIDERIRAMTIGAPAWSTRKKRIEDEEERLVGLLFELHRTLTAKGLSRAEVDGKIAATAAGYDLRPLNQLVAVHNRYYPIEANLPLDERGGGYLVFGSRRPWEPEEPYTAERLLRLLSLALS